MPCPPCPPEVMERARLHMRLDGLEESQKQLLDALASIDTKMDLLLAHGTPSVVATAPAEACPGALSPFKSCSLTFADQNGATRHVRRRPAPLDHLTGGSVNAGDQSGTPLSAAFINPVVSPRSTMGSARRMSADSGGSEPAASRDLAVRPGFEFSVGNRGSGTCSLTSSGMVSPRRSRKKRRSYVEKQVLTCSKGGLNQRSVTPKARKQRKAWDPECRSRMVYDAVCTTMMLYDAFALPYMVAWDLSEQRLSWLTGIWFTRTWWTFDVAVSFVTGFRDREAKLELALPAVARHYLRSWFFPDALMVLCDWLAEFGEGWNHTLRFLQVIRLMRVGRQAIRAYLLAQGARIKVASKEVHLAMDVGLLLLLILWVNHVVCCVWYFIGKFTGPYSDTGVTWLSDEEYSAAGLGYEYSTSLHWALTQMTPGSMEVFPASTLERVFNVAMLFFSLLLGSSLVATLTSMMTQYKLQKQSSAEKFMKLQKFLVQQDVGQDLAMTIKLQVKHRLKEAQRVKQKDVHYLELASTSLREALWHSCCMKQMSGHAFLNSLNLLDASFFQALCNRAVDGEEHGVGDAVFEDGSSGENMYFVTFGKLKYHPGELAAESLLHEADPRLTLASGSWCSEPALWTTWAHVGTLEAESTCELLRINAGKLVAELEVEMQYVLADYAKAFVHYLEDGARLSDLSDMIDGYELMSSLSQETRVMLAEPVLQSLRNRNWMSTRSTVELLAAEVADGKCNIGVVGMEAMRTVFVVALRLHRSEQEPRFLVKVGELQRDTGHVTPFCVLPGKKRPGQNTPKEVVDRMLTSDLPELRPFAKIDFSQPPQQTRFMQNSDKYRIRTRYLRTTFSAYLTGDPNLPCVRAERTSVYSADLRGLGQPAFFGMRNSQLGSAAGSGVHQQAADILEQQESAVALSCDDENRAACKLYLWLTQREFEVLEHEAAQPQILAWVTSLDLSQYRDKCQIAPCNSQRSGGSARRISWMSPSNSNGSRKEGRGRSKS